MKFNKLILLGLLVCGLWAIGNKPAAPLVETYWKLVEINGQAVTSAAPQSREAHFILKTDSTFNGSSGVNRFSGKYTLTKDKLTFLPPAATLMAGLPQAMETEDGFFKALEQTKKYKISSTKLSLLNEKGQTIAVLEAAYLQ